MELAPKSGTDTRSLFKTSGGGFNGVIDWYINDGALLIPGPHQAAQPKTSALRILRKYMARISVG